MISPGTFERPLAAAGVDYRVDLAVGTTYGWSIYDDVYRYALGREWVFDGPTVVYLMLNPSTATAAIDDQTLRQCRYFAERDHFGSLVVLNLFAYRATDPNLLLAAADDGVNIVGPASYELLRAAADLRPRPRFVAAWGSWGADREFRERAEAVELLLANGLGGYMTLGRTKTGQPRHPCRLPHSAKFEPA